MTVFTQAANAFCGTGEDHKPQPGFGDLLMACSKAQDLLKGKPLRTSLRVGVMAGVLARGLQLSPREINAVTMAALVCDLGLVKVAADVFHHLPSAKASEKDVFRAHTLWGARVVSSPYEPTQTEYLNHFLHAHPQASVQIAGRLSLGADVLSIIEAHHELCDGTGYPFGLTRQSIPIGARILTFADTVEGVMGEVSGLTTRQHALESFLEFKASDKFDADVIGVFKTMLKEQPDFLKQLASLEVETLIAELLPQRQSPLTGKQLLDICTVMGELPDAMLPLYYKGSSARTARFAVEIAAQLGIHPSQCGELLLAGLLHDIGQLSVPLSVLSKPGQLSDADWAVVFDHPRHTEEVLKGVGGFENVALWASEHHERMNGRGYPAQKKGFEISVGGRILALADAFVALTASRPYRTHAYEPMDALPVLSQGRATHFDAQLLGILRKVVLERDVPALRRV